MDLFGNTINTQPTTFVNPNPNDLLGGLLGTPITNTQPLGGLGGFSLTTTTTNNAGSSGSSPLIIKALEDSNIDIVFNCSKVGVV